MAITHSQNAMVASVLALVHPEAISFKFACRLPKPAEFASTDGLEKEKDEFDAKIKKITADLQPIMVCTCMMGGLEIFATY